MGCPARRSARALARGRARPVGRRGGAALPARGERAVAVDAGRPDAPTTSIGPRRDRRAGLAGGARAVIKSPGVPPGAPSSPRRVPVASRCSESSSSVAPAAQRVRRRHGNQWEDDDRGVAGAHPPGGGAPGRGRRERRDGGSGLAETLAPVRGRRLRSQLVPARGRARVRARGRRPAERQPDHLDRHGTFGAYLTAKLRVFARQGNDDVAVAPAGLGIEDLGGCARRVWFGRGGELDDREGHLWWDEQPFVAHAEIRLRGAHNRANAAAAAAIALARGVDLQAVRARAALVSRGRAPSEEVRRRRRALRQRLQGDERRLDARRAASFAGRRCT